MTYITSSLLTVAILFISYGVSTGNLIDTIIGSVCAGLYNGIINWRK